MNRKDAESVIKETIEYANNEIKKNKERSRRIVIATLSSTIIIVLLFCMIAYFYPLSLSDIVRENKRIDMILNEYKIEDGKPSIDSAVYNDITTEQKDAVLTLLEKYDYRRTFGTLFSNGSITDLADMTLTIFVYDDHSSVAAIVVASSGKMAVNDRSYSCKNAEQLIEQIIKIMEE